MTLSQEQIDFFWANGYLKIGKILMPTPSIFITRCSVHGGETMSLPYSLQSSFRKPTAIRILAPHELLQDGFSDSGFSHHP